MSSKWTNYFEQSGGLGEIQRPPFSFSCKLSIENSVMVFQRLTRIFMIVIGLEMVIAGGLIVHQMRQAAPQLPSPTVMDADTWIDLQFLARRAGTGFGRSWLDLADALVGKGFYSHAEIAYRRAYQMDPDRTAALEGIAFCEDRTGRIEESNQDYRQLLTRTSGEARQQALYALARNALRLDQPAKAEKLFHENIDFIPARFMYCKLLVDSGRASEAEPLIDAFLKQLPRSLLFRKLQDQSALQQGHKEKAQAAADIAERSLLLIPVNLSTDFIRERNLQHGFLHLWDEYQKYADYLTPGQKKETLLDLQEHLRGELSPYTIPMTKLLAEVAVEQKDLQGLDRILQTWSDLGISDAVTLERQGDADDLRGEKRPAVRNWEISVSMSPAAGLHRKLAKQYQFLGEAELSRQHLSEAALLEAQAAWQDDQLDRCLELVNQSLAENDKNAWSWYFLKKVQQARGNLAAADRAYEHYRALSPPCLRRR